MSVPTARDTQQLTVKIVLAEVPEATKEILAKLINEAALKGLCETTIYDHQVIDKNVDMSRSMKMIRKIATYLKHLGYQCVVEQYATSIDVKWL